MDARWDPRSLVVGPQPPSRLTRSNAPRPPGLDPYYRWAVFTNWRGFARVARWDRLAPDQHRIQIIVQLPLGASWSAACASLGPGAHVASVYGQPLPGQTSPTRHFTASLPAHQHDELLANPLGLRWKLAMPLRDAQASAQASPKGLNGPDRDAADMQARNRLAAAVSAARRRRTRHPASGPTLLPAALAVIDFGCPFLHRSLLQADGAGRPMTRVRAVWDQGSEPGAALRSQARSSWPWDPPHGFAQGRELRADMLDAITRAATGTDAPDESRIYRGIDHLIDKADPRRRTWRATHGGHVLSTAGGTPAPFTGRLDAAAAADLLFVQMPSLTAMDSSGGSLAAHLLDGVRYAMARVTHGGPLVVVISYGNCAGPHDGSSLIESALTELLDQRDENFAIVLAGGNARLDEGHVRRTVRRDRSAMLRLRLAEADTTDTFAEIWYPGSGPALQVRMRGPGRVWSDWIGQGQEQVMRAGTAEQEVVAMLRHDRHVPNGDGAHVLVAFAPTAQPLGVDCRLCEPGLWEIELRLADPKRGAVSFDAWIERDDPALPRPGPRTVFVDRLRGDEHHTVSSIANGAGTIKAFGFNLESDLPAPYSSLPRAPLHKQPERGGRLQVMVACEEDAVHADTPGAATRSDDVHRMRGTSVAAPVLARELFAAMQGAPVRRGEWADILTALIEDPAVPTVQRLRRD